MEQSSLTKHVQLMIRISTFFVVGTKLNNFFSLFRSIANAFFLFSTTACMYEEEVTAQTYISKLHDFIVFFTFLLLETCFIINRSQATSLISVLTGPLKNDKINILHFEIIKDYVKELKLYCKVVITSCIGGILLWCITSFIFMADTSGHINRECVHLAMGWVWNSDYYFYFLLLNLVCLFVTLSSCLQWIQVIYCMVIHIKCKCKLLSADIGAIEEFLDLKSSVSIQPNCSRTTTKSPYVKLKKQQKTDDQGGKESQQLANIFKNNDAVNFTKKLEERAIKRNVDDYLKILVEQHINIIRYVKLTDKAFRISIMVYTQMGVIIIALALSKLSFNENLLSFEVINRLIEVVEALVGIGLSNYFGQMLLNELESVRQALYNCDWTDKPHSLRRGLLIVQTMATRTQRLTIGGLYTLEMETYGNLLRATYSYTSLIQSLNSSQS